MGKYVAKHFDGLIGVRGVGSRMVWPAFHDS